MVTVITLDDLPADVQSAELVDAMLAGANARATRVAPCLSGTDPAPTEDQLAEAKLVLIGAVKRWTEAGAGAYQQETAGPFGVAIDTRQRTGYNLWPSEIEALQEICREVGSSSGAFSIRPSGSVGLAGHAPFCDLMFGGATCSCGYALTGGFLYPSYEA